MNTNTRFIVYSVFAVCFVVIGILIGKYSNGSKNAIYPFDWPTSRFEAVSDHFDNPDVKNYTKQLCDKSLSYHLSPLVVRVFDDKKRFYVHEERFPYTLVSQLYDYEGSQTGDLLRFYCFEENDVNIMLVITRDANTEKVTSIQYSFGDSISYRDSNVDGVWDFTNGLAPLSDHEEK
ncbi:MAG: hypothetical protein ACRC10_12980 [Thermoguttaceae bacterium]